MTVTDETQNETTATASTTQATQPSQPAPATEGVDQFGRTQADLDALAQKRAEAEKAQTDAAQAREEHAQTVADAVKDASERSMAVQAEVGTREKDARPPANVLPDLNADNRPIADRLAEIAATLHQRSPSGIETAQHELMALAAELRSDTKAAA